MYFIPVRNRLYSFGINVPAWQRYALTFGGLLVLVAVWYFAVFMPLMNAYSSTEREIKQLQEKQTVLAVTEKSLETTKQALSEHQKAFNAVIDDQSAAPVSLLAVVQQSSLQMTSYAPQAVQDNGWYTESKTTCNLTGTFDQIVAFLDACAKNKQPFGIASCSIAKRDDYLECNCSVQSITLKKEEPDEKKL